MCNHQQRVDPTPNACAVLQPLRWLCTHNFASCHYRGFKNCYFVTLLQVEQGSRGRCSASHVQLHGVDKTAQRRLAQCAFWTATIQVRCTEK
jgi:hypothetical protein